MRTPVFHQLQRGRLILSLKCWCMLVSESLELGVARVWFVLRVHACVVVVVVAAAAAAVVVRGIGY